MAPSSTRGYLRVVARSFLLWFSCVLASGCYLSHGTGVDAGSSDAAVPDVPGFDVPGFDVPAIDAGAPDVVVFDAAPDTPDAGPVECEGVRVAAELRLTNDWAALSPRLVALPQGEVGVVTVSSDGSPTRVHYQRVSVNLDRVGPSIVLTDRSFSWGQPASLGGTLYVAHAIDSAGTSGRSSLVPFTLDGSPSGRPVTVAASHPSFMSPASSGLFWLRFRNGTPNTLQVSHVRTDGEPLHDAREIDMGRYGSGSAAVRLPGGEAHVLAYTREASPGVRDGFVNILRSDGTLGPERRLSDDGDTTVTPALVGGELILVRHNDDALILERTDIETLERSERISFAPISGRPLIAQLAGRLLVIHFQGATMHVDDFGRELNEPTRLSVSLPSSATGAANLVESVASSSSRPGVVIADHARSDGESFPWLIRLGCDVIDG